jgi:hypothetical protein
VALAVTTTTSTFSNSGSSRMGGIVAFLRLAIQEIVSTETSLTQSSGASESDLIARILAQLTPFIQQTVSLSLT